MISKIENWLKKSKIIKWKNCIWIYQENKDEIEHTILNANALSLKKILLKRDLSKHILPSNNTKIMPQWMHDFLLTK